ncbi:MAG: IS66 family transposase [Saprospiraceae bacterium]
MDFEAVLAEKDAIIAAQHERFEKYEAETTSRIQQLEHQLAQLHKMIFGSKRERFVSEENPQQLSLFPSEVLSETAVTKQHIEYDRKTPKKHPGRTELPDHLPVEVVVIEPEEDTTGMKRIGEEITETLEYTPGSLVKKITIRPKYAKQDGEGVVIGKLPSRPIPKAIAEASLLSHIIVAKFIDHLPFYRQIQRFKRDFKWEVSDSTINEWFVAVCTLLHPLYEELKNKVLSSSYLQVDESPIKVLDQDHDKGIHQGYQWVYYSPTQKLVYFNYRKGRGQSGPKEILNGYQGILQTDGWQVYDKFASIPGIHLVGCLAHARRQFHEALETHKTKCEEVLAFIQRIYAAERLVKESSDNNRRATREENVHPIFDELRQWIDRELQSDIEPRSAFGKALTYINKQWPKLMRIIDHPDVELDNNLIENKIRPLALGRKNYLFAGSHAAAERIAMMYSFLGSCKAHGINPYDWLKTTLEQIPEARMTELHRLLPGREM